MRAFVIAILLSASSVLATEPISRLDVPYAQPASQRQTLDVYAPRSGSTHPIVFWIHGGGWRQGDKRSVQHKPLAFVDQGFLFVSTNYRFIPNVTIKEMTGDIAKAIRWTHDHAREFGGDPSRIFVMGHSAGAHLAALVCTDERYLQAEGLSLAIVKGCVPVDAGAYDVAERFFSAGPAEADQGKTLFGADQATHRELSPITYVGKVKSIPPFLILHVADRAVSKMQSERFAAALTKAGISASIVSAQGKAHGTINSDLGLSDDEPTRAVFSFLTRQLK